MMLASLVRLLDPPLPSPPLRITVAYGVTGNYMRVSLHPRLAGMATDMQDFAADLGGWMRAGARRIGGAEKRELAKRFGAWALDEQNLADAGLRAWIEDLDDLGREALAEQVAGFCADFELELAWLVDGELAAWPALEAGLRALVNHYCLACKAAVDCDADAVQFRRRRRWQQQRGNGTRGTSDD